MARKQGAARAQTPPPPREALKEVPPPVAEKTDPAPMPAPPLQLLTDDDVARLLAFLKTLDAESTPPSPLEVAPPVEAYIGMRVIYRLNLRDVDQIMSRRVKLAARGNQPVTGDPHVGLIVAIAGPQVASMIVFLDGEDTLWVQHRPHGGANGHWRPA